MYPRISFKRERGFTLVESMVAVMILAIGMVGLAYLQATGMRFTTSSYQRTQASVLAANLMDRIRSHGTDQAMAFHDIAYNTGDAVDACDAASAEIDDEISCWMNELRDAIPSGSAVITVDDTGEGVLVMVDMDWIERDVRKLDALPNDGNAIPGQQAYRQYFTTSSLLLRNN